MSDTLEIRPAKGPVTGTPRLPGSKSLTNRALLLAALASGTSALEGVLISDDTLRMVDCLQRLGIPITVEEEQARMTVTGRSGTFPASRADLYAGDAGTVARFLAAALPLGRGSYSLDGSPRMRRRPIQPLIHALQALEVDVQANQGFLPLRIRAEGLKGGRATLSAGLSSQFLSGLLMVSPHARSEVVLDVPGPVSSEPYIDMTIRILRAWDLHVETFGGSGVRSYRIMAPQPCHGRAYTIEPDASAASYFFAAAAITGGCVVVHGLGVGSLQGDVRFVEILAEMGADVTVSGDSITVQGTGTLRGVDVDMNDISDTVMTLAAIAPFAQGPTRIRNVAHIRHKESDRIQATVQELRRLGIDADALEDGLLIWPGATRGGVVETYNDHRIAMSFSLVGLRTPGVVIRDPGCVAKTFPTYFDELARLTP